MGCWQETCTMTHIPIYEDEPCVVVVFNKLFRELLKTNHSLGRFHTPEDFKYVEKVLHGTYNDYGWIKEIEDTKELDHNNISRPFSQRRVTIFFHKDVWLRCVKAGMKEAKKWERYRLEELELLKNSTFGHQPPTQDMIDFRAVYEVAYWTRRDLMLSHYFHGCQSNENQFYDVVHDLTNKMYNRLKQKENE